MPKLDKNIVFLEGVIGDDFKYGKSENGKDFATFSLSVNSFVKEISDQTERTHSQNYIRTTVFDKKQLEYIVANVHQYSGVFHRSRRNIKELNSYNFPL